MKIKLRGNDQGWDYDRLIRVGDLSIELGVEHLSADFNCTVKDPAYVNKILDRLSAERSDINRRILYVEQPFPYDLKANQIDVSSVSERQPLFLDESAHDWQYVALGRSLGWTGVALKTCKTQSGAILSLCWAKAHGMPLMVQDLTNPMLAQIPRSVSAHAGTIMEESNGMQFYPDASLPKGRFTAVFIVDATDTWILQRCRVTGLATVSTKCREIYPVPKPSVVATHRERCPVTTLALSVLKTPEHPRSGSHTAFDLESS